MSISSNKGVPSPFSKERAKRDATGSAALLVLLLLFPIILVVDSIELYKVQIQHKFNAKFQEIPIAKWIFYVGKVNRFDFFLTFISILTKKWPFSYPQSLRKSEISVELLVNLDKFLDIPLIIIIQLYYYSLVLVIVLILLS